MAKILVAAASSEPRTIVERMLAGHELAFAETATQAEQLLRGQRFDLILCTIVFDKSRMFELLQLAKSNPQWQPIPFACRRIRAHIYQSPVALQAAALTCRELGAAAFLDMADYSADPDREMRDAIERLLDTAV